jgi:hypothetical protein
MTHLRALPGRGNPPHETLPDSSQRDMPTFRSELFLARQLQTEKRGDLDRFERLCSNDAAGLLDERRAASDGDRAFFERFGGTQ